MKVIGSFVLVYQKNHPLKSVFIFDYFDLFFVSFNKSLIFYVSLCTFVLTKTLLCKIHRMLQRNQSMAQLFNSEYDQRVGGFVSLKLLLILIIIMIRRIQNL